MRRVTLDVAVEEYYQNEPVKKALVRYPLQVVRYAIDAEKKIRGGWQSTVPMPYRNVWWRRRNHEASPLCFIVQLPGLRH